MGTNPYRLFLEFLEFSAVTALQALFKPAIQIFIDE
jgi:hypothetical protein